MFFALFGFAVCFFCDLSFGWWLFGALCWVLDN